MSEDANPTTAYFTLQVKRFAAQYQHKTCFRDRLGLFIEAVRKTVTVPAKVLDFGCGPGIMSINLGQMGYDILGLDGASGMIETARANARHHNLTRVRFEQVDTTQFSFPPDEFDAVICSSVIEYINDDLGLVKKLVGALKPGGHLILSVPHTTSLLGKIEDLLRLSESFLHRESSRHLNYSLRRYKRRQLLVQLRDMGLQDLNYTSFEFPFLGDFGIKLSRCHFLGIMLLVNGRKSMPTNQPSETTGR